MHVKDAMTNSCEYIAPDATLQDAAKLMRKLDCGFLPIADKSGDKLQGVITDRDIVVRAVAEGMDPAATRAEEIKTDKVLYCFEGDGVVTAARSMQSEQVYRLIVLNNRDDKKLSGIVSLGDIMREGQSSLAAEAAEAIVGKAA